MLINSALRHYSEERAEFNGVFVQPPQLLLFGAFGQQAPRSGSVPENREQKVGFQKASATLPARLTLLCTWAFLPCPPPFFFLKKKELCVAYGHMRNLSREEKKVLIQAPYLGRGGRGGPRGHRQPGGGRCERRGLLALLGWPCKGLGQEGDPGGAGHSLGRISLQASGRGGRGAARAGRPQDPAVWNGTHQESL